MGELLDVVDRDDTVIGQVDRDHKLAEHIVRMVFVGFYSPNHDIFLQRRSLTKKSAPGKLTSTVSGHVSSGQSYLEAAVRETHEETGVELAPDDLTHLGTLLGGSAMRAVYAYPFAGTKDDLAVEQGDGAGFVRMPVATLLRERFDKPDKYVPFLKTDAGTVLLDYIANS